MRLLLDECVPQQLRFHLPGHEVATARFANLDGLLDDELLKAMLEEGYQALITLDRNLPYQQNLAKGGIAVLIISGRSTRPREVLAMASAVLRALDFLQPGQVVTITPDSPTA